MEYELVIGLEVHAELATQSKIFCACSTEFGKEVNRNTCPVCLGMPGTLPVLNKKAVEYAIMAGLSTNCEISSFSKLDRKNYFYPDSPKAYQISQFDLPLCKNGYLDIEVDGLKKRVGITRIHLEEDAGKLLHDENGNGSKIDYNRCGVPLIEIVTEPKMRSGQEAVDFVEKLKNILEYIEVSDCKMQEGSLRVDVNLSVRLKGSQGFGTRTEMKNLNSFRAMLRAIEYESCRQIEELNENRPIVQETRRWEDVLGESIAMRSKEDAHDYRYFPDPDLLPIEVEEAFINSLRNNLPELPQARKERYEKDFGLPKYDAELLTGSKHLSDFFEETVQTGAPPKLVSNFILGDLLRMMKDRNLSLDAIPLPGASLAKLVKLLEAGTINGTTAKKVFLRMFETGKAPEEIVKEEGLTMVTDPHELNAPVRKVLDRNPNSVSDYLNGKEKALGFLMGQAMKETRGKGNPQVLLRILLEEIKKYPQVL